jgi:hypothetical protein
MKQLLTTVLILSISIYSFAQKNRNSVSLSVGPSFPIAHFGSTEVYHLTNGFAKTGKNINICFEHKINNTFALSALFYTQTNPVNSREFAKNIVWWNDYSSSNYQFDKSKWSFTGLLVGGANEFNLSKHKERLFLNIKSLVGFAYGTGPKFNIINTSARVNSIESVSSNSKFGPSFLFSGGLKYNLNKKFFVTTNLQYFYVSEIKLDEEVKSIYNYTNRITPEVSTFNVLAGVGLRF